MLLVLLLPWLLLPWLRIAVFDDEMQLAALAKNDVLLGFLQIKPVVQIRGVEQSRDGNFAIAKEIVLRYKIRVEQIKAQGLALRIVGREHESLVPRGI